MNTQDHWQTTATIHDEHRAAVWGSIFPGARMPILSIIACRADLPGHPDALVYFLDLEAITESQREQLITSIAGLFTMDPEDVRRDLERGVPILAEDVSMSSTDQGMMMSLIDDRPASELPGFER
jgi:hypothetical protein